MENIENQKVDWKNPEAVKQYHADYNKVWYEKNKEKRREQIKAYSKAHPEDNVRRTQKYVAKHREKVRAYTNQFNKKYYASNSEEIKKQHQTARGRYVLLSYRAKKFGGEYLTFEEFEALFPRPCNYCGEDKGGLGIDRVDNSKGYTKENSVPCCKRCNYMKNTMTVKEFLNHVRKITRHNGD